MEKNTYVIETQVYDFLKELYEIMDEFNVIRIYSISFKNNKIIEAHQMSDTNIGNNVLTRAIFDILDDKFPFIYFNLFYRLAMRRYKRRLKKLFKKHNIFKINATSFNLYQGIYIDDRAIYCKGVEIFPNLGNTTYLDDIEIDI